MALDVELGNEAAASERNLGGRHLDASRDDALRVAALTLLAEIGYDRLTVDKIAASAGAGKATIYRRWSGKAELVVDALMSQKEDFVVADTGDLRGDLTSLALQASAAKEHPLDSQVMIGLVSALPRDPELRDVFYERLVNPHLATLKIIFERAVARGEIAPVKNLDTVVSILPALVLHRVIVMGAVPDEQFFVSIIDQVILPLVQAAAITPDPLT
ncbi:MAG TPA: TetR/AcrR family transcriptional regulator [Acidimicrobiales bacterium]